MPKLFGIDIAATLNQHMGPGLLPVSLEHAAPGTRTDSTGGTNPTLTTHTCRGFLDVYHHGQIDGDNVLVGDRKVLILGASISPAVVPEPGDKVTVEAKTYRVIAVFRDPAAATYTLQARVV